MSSTNRSNAREEHVADYYVTPIKDIEHFLKEFKKITPELLWSGERILDPCAGGDTKHPMSYPTAIKNIHGDWCEVDTMDIREDSLATITTDYLTYHDFKSKPEIIITNPPFNIAIDIIDKALDDVIDGGYVIMLLRLNFFGSIDRFPFFEKHMPKYCFVHHQRMSFIEKRDEFGNILYDSNGNPKKGSTDSIEYCHMVWQKGYKPEFTQLKVI